MTGSLFSFCLLRQRSACVSLVLAAVTAMLLWSQLPVAAQTPPAIRKVYVPDESPADWPKGDWRPLSTQKYLQWMRTGGQAEETDTLSRFQQVDYTCQYQNGRLINGRLSARQPYLPAGRDWVSLGQTNLSLAELSGPDQQRAWGTGTDRRLYVHRSLLEGGLTARWNMIGTPAAEGDQFTLELLPSQQSRLSILLPEHLTLQIVEPVNTPVFQRQVKEGQQEWIIEGVEKSTLSFRVTAVTESESQQTSIVRAVHQLTMSPSETSFVSDLKFEYIGRPARRVEVQLPAGMRVETVQWKLDSLTSWDWREADESEGTRLLVTLPETAEAGTLRVRGTIASADRLVLETTFPQLLDALTLSMQVNLLVRAPYLLEELHTTDLDQIDVRLVNGVRDVWSYQATGSQPQVKARVTQPDPQVRIEQLLRVEAEDQTQVHQMMLWKAQQEGVFHARFRIAPGYEVRDVALIGQSSDAGVSWNVLRQERGNMLIVHLANQLIPGQPLPVVVSLGNTFSNERSQRLTLPPLSLISGKVEQTYLVEQGLTILRTVPDRSDLPAMTANEAERWMILTEPRLAATPFGWQSSWRVVNISDLERVIVRPLPKVLTQEQTGLPGEQSVTLSTSLLLDGEDVLIRHRLNIPPTARRNSDVIRLHVPADQATWNWYLADGEDSSDRPSVRDAGAAAVQVVLTSEGNYEYRFYNGRGTGDDSEPLLWETYYRPANAGVFALTLPALETEWKADCEVAWQTGSFFVHAVDFEPTEMTLDGDLSRLRYSADQSGELTVRRTGDEAIPNGSPPLWQMEVAAFVSPETPAAGRVAISLTPPAGETVLALPELQFATPVEVSHLEINDRVISLRQSGRKITLPAIEEPVRKLVFSYTTTVADQLVLPELPMPIESAGLVLALAGDSRPLTSERISFWNETPRSSLTGDLPATVLVDTLQTDDEAGQEARRDRVSRFESRRAVWALLPEIKGEQAPTIYETTLLDPFSGDVPLVFESGHLAWSRITATFLITLIVCSLLLSFDVLPRFSWITLAGIGLVVAWCVTDVRALSIIYPITAALLIAATEMTRWRESWQRLRETDESQTETRAPALRQLLFRGVFGMLLLAVFVGKHEWVSAQTAPARQPEQTIEQYDILIPVAEDRLGVDFTGLTPDEYPDVIYATPALANRVSERAAPLQQLDEMLCRQSRFDIQEMTEERLAIRCEFTLLDPNPSGTRTRLLLPLASLSTLTDLKADVNGQTVNITPLPDESGLEIPLPQPAEVSTEETATDEDSSAAEATSATDAPVDTEQPADGEEAVETEPAKPQQSFREYTIVVNAVARQTMRGGDIIASLQIPPATLNQVNWSLEPGMQAELQLTTAADSGVPLVTDESTSGTLELGRMDRLSFDLDTRDDGEQAQARFEQLQTDVLCDVGLRHVELKMNVYVKFAPGSRQTMDWLIPEGMYLRGIHAPDVTDSRLSDAADGKTRLEMKFGAIRTGETSTALLSLMLPIVPGEGNIGIPLPQLQSRSKTDLVWQIALQAKGGGELTAIEFPEAASSRISQQTFVTSWPDMETILADVQCFRVKNPTGVKVLWNETVRQYNVSASHQLLRNEGQPIELRSRYRGMSRGRPFWMFEWLGAEGWTLEEVKASVDGREVQTRSIEAPVRSLAFSDDVTGSFEVTAVWVWLDAEQPSQFPFTPPRIAGAAPYRETVSQLIDDTRRYKLRVDEDASHQVEVTLSEDQTEELTLQGNNAFDLPPIILERQVGPTRPPAPRPRNEQAEPAEEPESEEAVPPFETPDVAAATPEIRSSGEQLISVDHTLWPERDLVHGESLIVFDSDVFSQQNRVAVELPKGFTSVEATVSAGLRFQQSPAGLIIQPSLSFETSPFRAQYVVLTWARSNPFSLSGQRKIPLPYVDQAAPVRMRCIRFDQNSGHDEAALISWQNYLRTLEKLGLTAGVEEEQYAEAELSPFTLEDESLQHWPAEYREYYRMLPETLQRRVYRGAERLRPGTRTKPSPEYFARVCQADTLLTDPAHAVIGRPGWQPHLWLMLVGGVWLVLIGQRRVDETTSRGQRITGRLVCLLLLCLMIWRLTA